MAKLESQFQAGLKKRLLDILPGCIVMKNDPSGIQGIPDLTILYKDRWATLECKKNMKASHRPNQEYYVQKMDDMSFSRFISPDNEEEVIGELKRHFGCLDI